MSRYKDNNALRAGIAIAFAVMLLLSSSSAGAQGRVTDTLRVVSTSIAPGDTGAVYIYIANSEQLGGYSFRLRFDHNVLGVVTVPGNDSTVEHTQLRGEFRFRGAGLHDSGVVTFVAAFPPTQSGMEAGRGNTIQFRFFAKSAAPRGTVSEIIFEDDPDFPFSFNRFSDWTGNSYYRPMLVSGFITVGQPTSLAIACPGSAAVSCNEDSDPAQTGRAIASDPAATITYQDEQTPGECAGESTIRRTWIASLSGKDTSCVQIIAVRDTVGPALNCPRNINVEFGVTPDPGRTGFATAIDNCDPSPIVIYTDAENPGTYPVHRVITRLWTGMDGCGNREYCRQVIRELAEGVPDTTTIPDGQESKLTLHPLWPNPFHVDKGGEDSIKYTVSQAGRVKLSIYDVAGRCLKTLVDTLADSAGTYKTTWDGKDADKKYVPSGVYICRLEFDGKAVIRKVAVLR